MWYRVTQIVCVYIHMYVYTCVYIYTRVHMHVCVYVIYGICVPCCSLKGLHALVLRVLCVCVYIYMYMYSDISPLGPPPAWDKALECSRDLGSALVVGGHVAQYRTFRRE